MTKKKAGPFRVVVAGRPNVGKSSIFNKLVRKRQAIVHDLPGMTRDVLESEAKLPDGRSYLLSDTGGYDPSGKEKIPAAVRDKAVAAIKGADLVFLVMDASAGVLAGDRAAARVIREAGRECAVVANKIDRKAGSEGEGEAWELGFPEVYGVSAEHDIGIDDLQTVISERLTSSGGSGESRAETDGPGHEIALAIVGRPNVGKSSLVNALLGEDRAIVSEIAGTTRDSVDARIEAAGRRFRLVDTAGIRRRGKTEQGPEVLSVIQARKRIEECDVALLVVDASEGPTGQDASVASYAVEAGRGLILVANKWDVAGDRETGTAEDFQMALASQIPFARHAPVILTSARTGRGISRILKTAAQVAENRHRRISTGELNRVLGRALRDKAPRSASGRPFKVFYVAQTGVAPPTFALVASRADPLHFSEERRIDNLIREGADFAGAPIRILVRERSGRREGETRGRSQSGRSKSDHSKSGHSKSDHSKSGRSKSSQRKPRSG